METNLEFTPAERLKIYKEILKRLKSETKYSDYDGICTHLYIVLKARNVCLGDRVYIKQRVNLFFPELPKIDSSTYLFSLDKEGNLKRIAIIEKAIKEVEYIINQIDKTKVAGEYKYGIAYYDFAKEVEVIAKPSWKRFFSKLAFWK